MKPKSTDTSLRAAKGGGAPRSRRGADAREKLLEAALDAFGRDGFDGASTRDIARQAGVNLAAIPYHFGGKDGLHRAVAVYIVDSISRQIGPAVAMVEAGPQHLPKDAASARIMLHRLLDAACDMLIGNPQAARWAPFIMRELMAPTPSFDIFYEGFVGRMHKTITLLYARATGREAEAEETIVRAFAIMGQLMVFRMARAVVLRRLAWKDYGPEQVAMVRAMLHEHLDALIDAEHKR
jgi:AcrR family transcriptional regulator